MIFFKYILSYYSVPTPETTSASHTQGLNELTIGNCFNLLNCLHEK